jgi:deazaflavin-dependent oxidoreductase (nitroreductase family)
MSRAIDEAPTDEAAIDWKALQRHWNCRLTVRGRKSGQERSVTIWYALGDEKVFLTGSGKGPQWLRNAKANPDVVVQIGSQRLRGRARVIEDPAEQEAVRLRFTRRYFSARIARALGTGYTDSTALEIGSLARIE